jgi:hypothetical protein
MISSLQAIVKCRRNYHRSRFSTPANRLLEVFTSSAGRRNRELVLIRIAAKAESLVQPFEAEGEIHAYICRYEL